eukprot:355524-Chlamydomonas_euryale.AAC.27
MQSKPCHDPCTPGHTCFSKSAPWGPSQLAGRVGCAMCAATMRRLRDDISLTRALYLSIALCEPSATSKSSINLFGALAADSCPPHGVPLEPQSRCAAWCTACTCAFVLPSHVPDAVRERGVLFSGSDRPKTRGLVLGLGLWHLAAPTSVPCTLQPPSSTSASGHAEGAPTAADAFGAAPSAAAAAAVVAAAYMGCQGRRLPGTWPALVIQQSSMSATAIGGRDT